jgi:Sec-independent protein translocase protein TatA
VIAAGIGLNNPVRLAILLLMMPLLRGARRLPENGRSLGEGMRGFKDTLARQGSPLSAPSCDARDGQQQPGEAHS